MAFKLKSAHNTSTNDPESLFRDLRSRKVEGLLAQQADTLRSYMAQEHQSDLALELPTGSGKTLVGLLIAEWRRRKHQERCVFLCPTKQLVNQVAEQAREKYGIPTLTFLGSKNSFEPAAVSAFENCEAIAISTYSSLFNINPFFDDVGVFIFDDAHSAENYVSSCWALEISKANDAELFSAMRQLIDPLIPEHDRSRFESSDDQPLDAQWVNTVPLPRLWDIYSRLVSVLDLYCTEGALLYRWRMLREHITACNLFYSSRNFLLRPVVPPTQSFRPFSGARQRIYMSATLGEGGDLERIFGQPKISRIAAPPGWDKQGIGRRFFVFPMRLWKESEAEVKAIEWIHKFPRAIILTPSDKESSRLSKIVNQTGYSILSADEIESSKKAFTTKDRSVGILANRYDGIDLNGDECRYLIISGLPEATNLQERFLITRMAASTIFSVRLRTRVVQAVGRCTRSATDWALVVILGEKIHRYFSRPEQRATLHPELQAEVEFGFEESAATSINDLEENITNFIAQNAAWKDADDAILESRDNKKQDSSEHVIALGKIVADEVLFLNALWNGQYERAVTHAKNVLAVLNGNALRGYRAWWNYLAGNAAFLASKSGQPSMHKVAHIHYENAAGAALTLPWLNLMRVDTSPPPLDLQRDADVAVMVERLENNFEKFGSSNSTKIERQFLEIRSGLISPDSEKFETAQVALGALLGFESHNSSASGAPDPWWIIGKRQGIVFEDYTATGDNPRISKAKTLQAKGHTAWLAQHHQDIDFSVVLCTSSNILDEAAYPFVENLSYCAVSDFVQFSEDAFKVVRKLWDAFPGVGDLAWRGEAAYVLQTNSMAPNDILTRLTKHSLSDLREKPFST